MKITAGNQNKSWYKKKYDYYESILKQCCLNFRLARDSAQVIFFRIDCLMTASLAPGKVAVTNSAIENNTNVVL